MLDFYVRSSINASMAEYTFQGSCPPDVIDAVLAAGGEIKSIRDASGIKYSLRLSYERHFKGWGGIIFLDSGKGLDPSYNRCRLVDKKWIVKKFREVQCTNLLITIHAVSDGIWVVFPGNTQQRGNEYTLSDGQVLLNEKGVLQEKEMIKIGEYVRVRLGDQYVRGYYQGKTNTYPDYPHVVTVSDGYIYVADYNITPVSAISVRKIS
jgi:hypothetical protein